VNPSSSKALAICSGQGGLGSANSRVIVAVHFLLKELAWYDHHEAGGFHPPAGLWFVSLSRVILPVLMMRERTP
jgi:hypothetical protein